MKSTGPVIQGGKDKLEIYVVRRTNFENPDLLDSCDIY